MLLTMQTNIYSLSKIGKEGVTKSKFKAEIKGKGGGVRNGNLKQKPERKGGGGGRKGKVTLRRSLKKKGTIGRETFNQYRNPHYQAGDGAYQEWLNVCSLLCHYKITFE